MIQYIIYTTIDSNQIKFASVRHHLNPFGASAIYQTTIVNEDRVFDSFGNKLSSSDFLNNFDKFDSDPRTASVKLRIGALLTNRVVHVVDPNTPQSFARANTVSTFGRL